MLCPFIFYISSVFAIEEKDTRVSFRSIGDYSVSISNLQYMLGNYIDDELYGIRITHNNSDITKANLVDSTAYNVSLVLLDRDLSVTGFIINHKEEQYFYRFNNFSSITVPSIKPNKTVTLDISSHYAQLESRSGFNRRSLVVNFLIISDALNNLSKHPVGSNHLSPATAKSLIMLNVLIVEAMRYPEIFLWVMDSLSKMNYEDKPMGWHLQQITEEWASISGFALLELTRLPHVLQYHNRNWQYDINIHNLPLLLSMMLCTESKVVPHNKVYLGQNEQCDIAKKSKNIIFGNNVYERSLLTSFVYLIQN